jgi:hypothetical protein
MRAIVRDRYGSVDVLEQARASRHGESVRSLAHRSLTVD